MTPPDSLTARTTYLDGIIPTKTGALSDDLKAYRAGHYLAYWTFPAADWDAYLAIDERRVRRSEWFFGLTLVAVGVALAALLNFSPGNQKLGWVFKTVLPLSGGLLAGMIFMGVALASGGRTHGRLHREGGHAFIAADSAFYSAGAKAWVRSIHRLTKADIRPPATSTPADRPILVLIADRVTTPSVLTEIARLAEAVTSTYNPNNSVVLNIPIPRGAEAEAERIVALLRESIAIQSKK